VRRETAAEVLREAEDVGARRARGDLREDVARQLAHLRPLKGQLALRVAARDSHAEERGEDRPLLRIRQPAEADVEVGDRAERAVLIAALERAPEVVEADAQTALRGQESLEARQRPARPGSIRVQPSSTAQRSMAIETRSSTSGIGRASLERSIDFT